MQNLYKNLFTGSSAVKKPPPEDATAESGGLRTTSYLTCGPERASVARLAAPVRNRSEECENLKEE